MDINQAPTSMMALPTVEDAANALNEARLKAAVGFNYMVEVLALRGFDPSVSTRSALDISEHLYKVSGMAQKQAVQPIMPTVKFTFNATAPSPVSKKESNPSVTIDMEPVNAAPVEFDDTDLGLALDFLDSFPTMGNRLQVDLEDE